MAGPSEQDKLSEEWGLDEATGAKSADGKESGDWGGDMLNSDSGDDDGGSSYGAAHVLFLRADGSIERAAKISSLAGGHHIGFGSA